MKEDNGYPVKFISDIERRIIELCDKLSILRQLYVVGQYEEAMKRVIDHMQVSQEFLKDTSWRVTGEHEEKI